MEDERVQKAIEWICKYQRADDGDGKTYVDKQYERLDICFGNHACHMGVAKSLKALAAIPEDLRSAEVIQKIKELSEYFLIHHIYKKSHNLEETSKPGWLKIGFPLMYQTDVLELMSVFADLKIKDVRLEDAIEVIAGKKTEDGIWLMENTMNGKMLVDVEKKGKPSKWMTLKALQVLKFYR
jgi:hypothetical protein